MAMFDKAAERFDRHAADGAYNAYYDRPAVLTMLGEVDGLVVLDAGCGSGLYSAELITRGAKVIGIDESAEMIRIARSRAPEADLRVHDLARPLDFLGDKSVDRVLMALVLHHLTTPVATLRECHRVLRDNGRLVLSTGHPTDDWRRLGGSYFTDARVQETWSMDLEVNYRRAPLSTLVREFAEAGFVIESLEEPLPAPGMQERYPEAFRKLTQVPAFLNVTLMKHPGSS